MFLVLNFLKDRSIERCLVGKGANATTGDIQVMIKIKSSHGCSATSVSPKIGGNKIINHIVTS